MYYNHSNRGDSKMATHKAAVKEFEQVLDKIKAEAHRLNLRGITDEDVIKSRLIKFAENELEKFGPKEHWLERKNKMLQRISHNK
jgi:hypothetical protein